MNFQWLTTFRTVATLNSFNGAAQVLHYAQSSISAQIKALEEELGATLFNRIGKQIHLTEAGAKMLSYADKILSIAEEARADVSGNKDGEGVITIRAPQTVATYYFPHILAAFHPLYPKISFDVNSCAFHSLEDELKIGTVDVAFLLADSVYSATLAVEMIGEEKLVVAASPGHPLARYKRVGYQELAAYSIFLPKADCGYRMIFERELTERRIESVRINALNSIEAIKQCVKAGLGVTVIPEIAVRREIAANELTPLSWEKDLEVAVLMIRNKNRWLSPGFETFLETAKQITGELSVWGYN